MRLQQSKLQAHADSYLHDLRIIRYVHKNKFQCWQIYTYMIDNIKHNQWWSCYQIAKT